MTKKNLLDYFAETLDTRGSAVAIEDDGRTITFRELANAARCVAADVCRFVGDAVGRPVGVFIGKSIESAVADLGIVQTGNAYMNLDVKMPLARIRNILERIQPACIVATPMTAGRLSEVWPREKMVLVEENREISSEAHRDELPDRLDRVIDTDPLCIINTSGSTGTPKGVVLNHRSFINYTLWAIETLGIGTGDVLGSIAPIVFDHFSYEFCLMLVRGCKLLFVPEGFAMFPARLLRLLAERRVTYIFWVPTLMVNIANMELLPKVPLPDLRLVCFAGEVFPTKQFNHWRKHLPHATFVNLYGPTEITVDCTYYVVDREFRDDEPLPIGRPCRNTDILILNGENRLVGRNEPGELCVRGSSLAMGYYNDSEKTAAAFVQNPLNTSYPERIYRTGDIVFVNDRGEIVYKGRNDTLIKHMGKRVELGEIEHVAINILGVARNGCATYDHDKGEIVFFYEAEEELSPGELRRKIASALPNYMVPTRYIHVPEMPRNTNGKIDRAFLNARLRGAQNMTGCPMEGQ